MFLAKYSPKQPSIWLHEYPNNRGTFFFSTTKDREVRECVVFEKQPKLGCNNYIPFSTENQSDHCLYNSLLRNASYYHDVQYSAQHRIVIWCDNARNVVCALARRWFDSVQVCMREYACMEVETQVGTRVFTVVSILMLAKLPTLSPTEKFVC